MALLYIASCAAWYLLHMAACMRIPFGQVFYLLRVNVSVWLPISIYLQG